jgi:2-C-methyl-D-erythritol 4-phosphate cytidylyltransferase / 2-C-methyl-D-erythritol 2,4-cyclodiphosphate synthase
MTSPPLHVALIVAAGKGMRAGGDVPKQYSLIGGKAMVAHSVDAFAAHPAIDAIYVVIGEGQRDLLTCALADRPVDGVIIGGTERQDSVRIGLAAIGVADHVLIHDAARPLLPAAVIDRLLAALTQADGAVPVLPVVDTVARRGDTLGDTIDRNTIVRVQTPQAFRYDAIMSSHRNWQGGVATDDAQMARAAGFAVAMVEGDVMLEKVTHATDFASAETRIGGMRVSRTGFGYDVHRLEAGPALWLCGIEIDHDKGLSGHSDADVALHALTDALLGAISAGDIGDHFPPSDPQWRGVASSRFVEHAVTLIEARGARIANIDLTIICEAPRIGPHRGAMRARIAELLRVDIDRVSVKATTTERLGFTGRSEGIAAQAVATITEREQ